METTIPISSGKAVMSFDKLSLTDLPKFDIQIQDTVENIDLYKSKYTEDYTE